MTSPTLNLYYLPFETEDLFYLNRSPARSVGELREEIYTRQDVLFRRNGITMAELALYAPNNVSSGADPQTISESIVGLKPLNLQGDFRSLLDSTLANSSLIHIIVSAASISGLSKVDNWDPNVNKVMILKGDEKRVCDRIAFCLYNYLWMKPWNFDLLVEPAEEDIPKTESTDEIVNGDASDSGSGAEGDKKPFSPRFIDLRKVPNFPTEQQTVFLERFLIRKEYEELEAICGENRNSLLLGHPGIGKTVYLVYRLLKRLSSGNTTFLALRPDVRYIFREVGVVRAPNDTFSNSMSDLVESSDPNRLAMFDLNKHQDKVIDFREWKVILASPPQLKLYKYWSRETRHDTVYMKTWEWAEVYSARDLALEKRGLDQWRTAYMKYGGSARSLFANREQELNSEIDMAVVLCKSVNVLLEPTVYGVNDDMSHHLVEINPFVEANGKIKRNQPTGKVISHFILEKLLDQRKAELAVALHDSFRRLLRSDASRSAAGMYFEGAGHRYMYSTRMKTHHICSLSDPSKTVNLKLAHITRFTTLDALSLAKFDPKSYYRRLSGNVHGFHSFVPEVNSKQEIVGIVLFQFTVGGPHPINPSFLGKLLELHGSEAVATQRRTRINEPKWKLVFVVPRDIAPGFRRQPWAPSSRGETWDDRIDQYVLGVDEAKVWDALRDFRY